MPVRSLSSSVLKWPDAPTVEAALRDWAKATALSRPDVSRIGYIGSYARGDWGVGSDLDIVIVLRDSAQGFEERALVFDTTGLPVPSDVLVYTEPEFQSLVDSATRFGRTLRAETVWLFRSTSRPGH